MKILLVWPPQFNLAAAGYMRRIQSGLGSLPPLGLLSLASWINEKSLHQAEILDALHLGLTVTAIVDRLAESRADCLGISCLTHSWFDCCQLAKAVKKRFPNLPIIIGGPHCTLYPEESLQSGLFDFLIAGEGELPLQSLLDALSEHSSTESLPAVMYPGGPRQAAYWFSENLDELPICDRRLLDWKSYTSVVSRNVSVATLMSSRGCPYRCRFCYTAGGKQVRAFSARRCVDEIEQCLALGITEFFFFDELFTAQAQRVFEFCDEVQRRHLNIAWDVRSRVDTVSPEMLVAMAQAGCRRIQYGIEAGTAHILKVLGKGITVEQAAQAVEMTKRAGIAVYADFMIGCPEESEAEIAQTLAFAKALPLDYAHFAVLMLYPQTEFYRLALEQGVLQKDVWRDFVLNPRRDFKPPYWEGELSAERLEELVNQAFRSFYWRPHYLLNRIKNLKSWGEGYRQVKAAWHMFAGGTK